MVLSAWVQKRVNFQWVRVSIEPQKLSNDEIKWPKMSARSCSSRYMEYHREENRKIFRTRVWRGEPGYHGPCNNEHKDAATTCTKGENKRHGSKRGTKKLSE